MKLEGGIPVGPGGHELTHRQQLMFADALARFRAWQKQAIEAGEKYGYQPLPSAIAEAWGSALWNACLERTQFEKAVFDQYSEPPT